MRGSIFGDILLGFVAAIRLSAVMIGGERRATESMNSHSFHTGEGHKLSTRGFICSS